MGFGGFNKITQLMNRRYDSKLQISQLLPQAYSVTSECRNRVKTWKKREEAEFAISKCAF